LPDKSEFIAEMKEIEYQANWKKVKIEDANQAAHSPQENQAKGQWSLFNTFISHPVISTIVGGLLLCVIALVIYGLWGVNLMDPSSSKPLFHSASPTTATTSPK